MNKNIIRNEIDEIVEALEMVIKRQADNETKERIKTVAVNRIIQIIERELNDFTGNFKK